MSEASRAISSRWASGVGRWACPGPVPSVPSVPFSPNAQRPATHSPLATGGVECTLKALFREGRPMASPLLEVREVRKSYGATPALRGVSFVVNEGEMFGLLGPNGAGKTTLLSILAGLSPASSGEVRLAGQAVQPGNRAVRRLIGVVPQDLAVYGSL